MIKWLLLFTGFLFATLTCVGLLQLLFRRELVIERRIAPMLKNKLTPQNTTNQASAKKAIRERLLQPATDRLRNKLEDKMSRQEMKDLEKKLREAGHPFGLTAVDFRLIQIGLGLGLFLLVFLMGFSGATSMGKLMLLATAVGIYGVVAPGLYLNAKKKRRMLTIQKAMPDFFDMVNVSIEAGMGLDGSLAKVCTKLDSPLSAEFLRTLDEMKLGKSRREAFSNLRDRVPLDQFQSIISALIQADQLGIGMSKVLRSLSQRIREQRRELAREQAMKAPVKMLFPMVFFIFPTLFIVLLGPLAILILTGGLRL